MSFGKNSPVRIHSKDYHALVIIIALLLLLAPLTSQAFDSGSGPSGLVSAIAVQADGKIVIGGSFTGVNGHPRNRIARLNADGSVDQSFNPGGGADDFVETVAVQADGKIVIGGGFTGVNGHPRNRIARLNADGSVDQSFNPGSGANTFVFAVAVQADGNIVIGGFFTSVNGTPRNRIARLNADGSVDQSFNPGSGADDFVETVAIQADGKIVIGGVFLSVNGAPRNRIARLNADGSVDTSFDVG